MSFLPDPCPLPEAIKKRALNEKERMIYAPMAGVGGVVYDKDAVYIDLPGGLAKQQQVRGTCHICFSVSNITKDGQLPLIHNTLC